MTNTLVNIAGKALDIVSTPESIRHLRQQEVITSRQKRKNRMLSSAQFQNGTAITKLPKQYSHQSTFQTFWKYTGERHHLKPKNELPYMLLDAHQLRQVSDELRITWLGHSSLFIEMSKQRILIDPVFEHASPNIVKALFKRNVSIPTTRENLPMPDVIVISHDHYDHLEKETMQFYADKNVHFLVPLGVGEHLEKWGVSPSKIKEFDWWESAAIKGVIYTATPANHQSGRTGLDTNKTLWASWCIHSQHSSVFYSGDTAYDKHFKEIGERMGPFDVAFMEVAANVKKGRGFPVENWGHMQARHTVKAFHDVKAKSLFPVHWSTYELFTHKWDEPIQDLMLEVKRKPISLLTPLVGQSIYLHSPQAKIKWWDEVNYLLEGSFA
ncbi:MBL fold metallo-hydrolase [Vibrio casei]|uniref:MBL fold metallo-hydrolase n=2 Tax=Vibrionaceae TaxID=641 RepID=A0A368LH80_9VIBR|nr:MBL fold metallo-hydrolase [Vibrio casei]RCS70110.1 MBL fold metallo-hydrolase [Vibrio casei]SJN24048.1 Outer membrane protein romA [Vibrio casei]